MIDALEMMMSDRRDDAVGAVWRIIDPPNPNPEGSLFSAACVWAKAAETMMPDKREDKVLQVEVERTVAAHRDASDDTMESIAAFLAAAGNDDHEGAYLIWKRLRADQEQVVELAMTILNVAALIGRRWVERQAS